LGKGLRYNEGIVSYLNSKSRTYKIAVWLAQLLSRATHRTVATTPHFQHAPSAHMAQAHLCCKMLVLFPHQSLHQDVSNLVSSWYILEFYFFILNFVPQEMVTDVNVFHLVMELWVACNSNHGLIVNV
jgi:hypothetical protein